MNLGGSPIRTRDNSGNSAACTQSPGAVFQRCGIRVWVPPVGRRRTLGRVARPAEHRAVGDVEGRATGCERHDVIDGQVTGWMGVTVVAGAPVAVLTAPGPQQSCTQTLPLAGAVQRVVAATVRLSSVRRAATAGPAGDDAAHRAELHGSARSGAGTVAAHLRLVTLDCTPFDIGKSVSETGGAVYSPAVLRLRCYACGTNRRATGSPTQDVARIASDLHMACGISAASDPGHRRVQGGEASSRDQQGRPRADHVARRVGGDRQPAHGVPAISGEIGWACGKGPPPAVDGSAKMGPARIARPTRASARGCRGSRT